MQASAAQWARGYYRQAIADWEVWGRLTAEPVYPPYLALHVLQMSTEKLAKAYRLNGLNARIEDVNTSHKGFEGCVAAVLNVRGRQLFPSASATAQRQLRLRLQSLARDIERLSPSVDPMNTPRNTEYPWQSGPIIRVPCDDDFSELMRRLRTVDGARLLRVIQAVVVELNDALREG